MHFFVSKVRLLRLLILLLFDYSSYDHRLLSLSVEGKVAELLQLLARLAILFHPVEGKTRIRQMVRQLIVQYPLLLGMSMERVQSRFDEIRDVQLVHNMQWDEIVNYFRRSEDAHLRWKKKIIRLHKSHKSHANNTAKEVSII